MTKVRTQDARLVCKHHLLSYIPIIKSWNLELKTQFYEPNDFLHLPISVVVIEILSWTPQPPLLLLQLNQTPNLYDGRLSTP